MNELTKRLDDLSYVIGRLRKKLADQRIEIDDLKVQMASMSSMIRRIEFADPSDPLLALFDSGPSVNATLHIPERGQPSGVTASEDYTKRVKHMLDD
jgi:hypothetical protein